MQNDRNWKTNSIAIMFLPSAQFWYPQQQYNHINITDKTNEH